MADSSSLDKKGQFVLAWETKLVQNAQIVCSTYAANRNEFSRSDEFIRDAVNAVIHRSRKSSMKQTDQPEIEQELGANTSRSFKSERKDKGLEASISANLRNSDNTNNYWKWRNERRKNVSKANNVQGNVFCKFVPYNENLPHNPVNPMAVLLGRTAMFPVQWWTCYERPQSGKTGPKILLKPHIDVYKMLSVWIIQLGGLLQDLKLIQRNHDKHYEDYLGGILLQKKQKIYYEADAKIQGKVLLYANTNLI
uniref:Uncharacterized protein n=1 Tax=Ditylenchus dipsaci TaxID=166011 RepID=A0A915DHP5_9BILA